MPAEWWDSCCDKCLLLGVFKHGWEKYLAIRDDPAFCFYRHVYGPDAPTIPIPSTVGSLRRVETEVPTEVKPDEEHKQKSVPKDEEGAQKEEAEEVDVGEENKTELPQPIQLFPSVADLNSRTRKLIAYFQRIRTQFELESLHSLRAEGMSATNTMTGGQSYMEQRMV